jgi:hypothetical protein
MFNWLAARSALHPQGDDELVSDCANNLPETSPKPICQVRL